MYQYQTRVLAITAVTLLLVGCHRASYEAAESSAMYAESVAADESAPLRADARFAAANAGTAGTVLTMAMMGQVQQERYLIKDAVVTIECPDPRQASQTLTKAAADAGGYVADFNESTDGYGRRLVNVTVRVPADRFDDAILELETLGKVLNKEVTTQDVTEEYVDTESQSRNLKATEERIIEHLGRAGTLEDILHVERELSRVRQEVERLDGRIRFLSHRVAYSTMTVSLRETPAAESILPAETFSVGKNISEASRSLVELGQVLLVFGIWIAVWSPVWLGALLLIWILKRRVLGRATA